MNWIQLNSTEQIEEINLNSKKPIIIFKHSTRCSVSGMAKRNVEYEAPLLPEGVSAYFLDLIKYRELSNQVADRWNVRHESPQILLIHNQECIYHASHSDISIADITLKVNQLD